jgi:hypothetical protein
VRNVVERSEEKIQCRDWKSGQFSVTLQCLGRREENSLSKYASRECQFIEDVWTFCMFIFTWKLNLNRCLQGQYTNSHLMFEFQIGNVKPLDTMGLTVSTFGQVDWLHVALRLCNTRAVTIENIV